MSNPYSGVIGLAALAFGILLLIGMVYLTKFAFTKEDPNGMQGYNVSKDQRWIMKMTVIVFWIVELSALAAGAGMWGRSKYSIISK